MTGLFTPAMKVEKYLRDLGVQEASICVYSYRRRHLHADQRIVTCNVNRLAATYQELADGASAGREIAIRSRCVLKDGATIRHLPMLDWRGRKPPPKGRLQQLARAIGADEFALFDSGRSFHIYFKTLLDQSKFSEFMTQAVLVENRDSTSGVDYRWVAHRLLDGFATLRWSAVTKRHRREPILKFVGKVRRLQKSFEDAGNVDAGKVTSTK